MQTAGFTWWVKSVYLSFNGACLHFSEFVKCGAFSLKNRQTALGPVGMLFILGGSDSWFSRPIHVCFFFFVCGYLCPMQSRSSPGETAMVIEATSNDQQKRSLFKGWV